MIYKPAIFLNLPKNSSEIANRGETQIDFVIRFVLKCHFGLQCFDAVGWAAGRASGL